MKVLKKVSILRTQKDTAHTRAERNILEAVKVIYQFDWRTCTCHDTTHSFVSCVGILFGVFSCGLRRWYFRHATRAHERANNGVDDGGDDHDDDTTHMRRMHTTAAPFCVCVWGGIRKMRRSRTHARSLTHARRLRQQTTILHDNKRPTTKLLVRAGRQLGRGARNCGWTGVTHVRACVLV